MHRIATTRRERLVGLLGTRVPPPPGDGLLLEGCRSVHTCGMRYPLRLTWLDADGAVLRVDAHVPPWRVRWCRGDSAVLEQAV